MSGKAEYFLRWYIAVYGASQFSKYFHFWDRSSLDLLFTYLCVCFLSTVKFGLFSDYRKC